jgi:hypothetical protein
MLHQDQDLNLMWTTARTLQYLRLDCKCKFPPFITLAPTYSYSSCFLVFHQSDFLRSFPSLPSLRFLELALRFVDRSTAWFFTIISDILAANSKSGPATIEELIVTYCPTESNGAAMVIPASLKSWSLRALENSLLSHRGSPRIRWRVGFMQVHRPEHFKKFTTFIRRAMPQLNRTGRLSFEQFEPDWDGYAGLVERHFRWSTLIYLTALSWLGISVNKSRNPRWQSLHIGTQCSFVLFQSKMFRCASVGSP